MDGLKPMKWFYEQASPVRNFWTPARTQLLVLLKLLLFFTHIGMPYVAFSFLLSALSFLFFSLSLSNPSSIGHGLTLLLSLIVLKRSTSFNRHVLWNGFNVSISGSRESRVCISKFWDRPFIKGGSKKSTIGWCDDVICISLNSCSPCQWRNQYDVFHIKVLVLNYSKSPEEVLGLWLFPVYISFRLSLPVDVLFKYFVDLLIKAHDMFFYVKKEVLQKVLPLKTIRIRVDVPSISAIFSIKEILVVRN